MPNENACPVCGANRWRWTDFHGIAACGECGQTSALYKSAANLKKGDVLPQSTLKDEWLPRFKQWWAETKGAEGFEQWWDKQSAAKS